MLFKDIYKPQQYIIKHIHDVNSDLYNVHKQPKYKRLMQKIIMRRQKKLQFQLMLKRFYNETITLDLKKDDKKSMKGIERMIKKEINEF